MAQSGYIDLSGDCTVAEALRKYSGNKAWCTRYTNKINKSQPLLDKQYDRRTDEIGAENLKKSLKQSGCDGPNSRISCAEEIRKG